MPDILNFTRAELGQLMTELGYASYRAEQIMRWVYHQNVCDFDKMANLPKEMRVKLAEQFSFSNPTVQSESISHCGTIKWLIGCDEKNAVETVYIPDKKRATLCISSQVGCALACQFCATGMAGFLRNLSTAEIISQVYFAGQRIQELSGADVMPRISNIVFMGMGEPLLNEHNVFRAVEILLDDLAFGLSKHRVTVSTSGIAPAMHRLADQCQAALAVSIHAANDKTRSELVPINRRYEVKKLIEACDYYTRITGRSITYEYVMLNNQNDSVEDANALAALLGPRHAKVNLIPYNTISSLTLKPSSTIQIEIFRRILQQKGIITTVRKTRGDDIAAACGQLYGQVQERKKRIADYQFLAQPNHNISSAYAD